MLHIKEMKYIKQINEMYADYKFNAVAHKFNELKQNVVIP